MQATAVQKSIPQPTIVLKNQKVKAAPRQITWREFQNRYLSREDGFKYEWVGGVAEKSPYVMDQTQAYILRNLLKAFRQMLIAGKVNGELLPETDTFFKENHRRPDLCWLTDEQIDRASPTAYQVPTFVIEVISTNDQANRIERKMGDYRRAGVQVVWHVFPEFQMVHLYSGEGLQSMLVRNGDQICSAAPALPGFEMATGEVFKRPTLG